MVLNIPLQLEVKKFAAGSRQLLMTIKVTPTHKAPGATVKSAGDLKCGFMWEHTLPETNIALENWWVGRLLSFWEGLFSGAILVSGSVLVVVFVSSC